MNEYDKTLECVSHAGRHRCNGTCRTQHLKDNAVDCIYFVSKED
jgi:hypothetical protein